MSEQKTLTFSIMDGPFEQARIVTALRLMDLAIRAGHNINVFAYEGAVGLPFAKQAKHANAVHERDLEEEDHPLPREWIASLFKAASGKGVTLDWANCGLCVDERGMDEVIEGCRRGTPGDLWKWSTESDNTLIIGTR
jgi:tRNA 2-thiouridine synthesizing protein D